MFITLKNGVRMNTDHIQSYVKGPVDGSETIVKVSGDILKHVDETPDEIDSLIFFGWKNQLLDELIIRRERFQ